jgi:hypothetical protein
MKKLISLGLKGICMLVSFGALAQGYPEEALIFSRTNPGGSARIQGMGGAQVALGGDYSTAYSNPAGLGFFNRSEVTLSLGTNFYNSSASYLGTSTSDSKSNFNIPGLSLVLHTDKSKGKLLSGNFAITFNRTNNFNQNFTYQGVNNNTSMIDYFVVDSSSPNGPFDSNYFPSQFNPNGNSYSSLSRLAFNNYLIGPLSEVNQGGDSSRYHTYINQIPLQHERVQISGAQNQWNIAYGVNLEDKFYLGASIGIPTINYQSSKVYTESFSSGPLYGFEVDQNLHITGTGVNATLGAIIKPKDFIQFGLSVSSPTYYPTLSENYTASLTSGWNNYSYVDATYSSHNTVLNGGLKDSIYFQSPFLYSLTTPWRIKAGATFFIQKKGLITAEVERINFTNANFGSNSNTPADFSSDNSLIKSLFHNVFNIRVGGEYRFGNFRGRLGYNYMPNPYSLTQNNVDNTTTSYTAGVGYRSKKYFVDLGFIQTQWNSSYLPYSRGAIRNGDDQLSPIVTIKNSNLSAMITVGYNF